jgi:GxxExxY protein
MNRREREDRGGSAELNALTEKIIGAAIKVHCELGPGLLESAYEACLCYELTPAGRSSEATASSL